MKKKLMTVLALVLVIAMSVAGTYAYLTSQVKVENTFTVGNVSITMDEAKVNEYGQKLNANDQVAAAGDTLADRVMGNKYKLVPGHEYTKDPTIHVGANSEDCYLFVEITNGLGDKADINGLVGWTQVAEGSNVYYYNTKVSANDNVVVFNSFTFAENGNPVNFGSASIVIKACAIQADGFATPVAAYESGAVAFGA